MCVSVRVCVSSVGFLHAEGRAVEGCIPPPGEAEDDGGGGGLNYSDNPVTRTAGHLTN